MKYDSDFIISRYPDDVSAFLQHSFLWRIKTDASPVPTCFPQARKLWFLKAHTGFAGRQSCPSVWSSKTSLIRRVGMALAHGKPNGHRSPPVPPREDINDTIVHLDDPINHGKADPTATRFRRVVEPKDLV